MVASSVDVISDCSCIHLCAWTSGFTRADKCRECEQGKIQKLRNCKPFLKFENQVDQILNDKNDKKENI